MENKPPSKSESLRYMENAIDEEVNLPIENEFASPQDEQVE